MMTKNNLDPYLIDKLESLVGDHEMLENVKSEKRLVHYGSDAGKLGQVVI